jgi:hypothetical protein
MVHDWRIHGGLSRTAILEVELEVEMGNEILL